MEPDLAVDLVRTLAEAVAYNIGVWHRGGKGTNAGNRQKRAMAEVFAALTGREPTAEELDRIGGSAVFGGL